MRSRMAWNSRVRYSPSTSAPVRHVLAHAAGRSRGSRGRPIDGAVTHGAAGDVVQVADHQVVVGRAGVLAGVGVQLVGERGAERAGLGSAASAASRQARTTVAWMIISEIFSLMWASPARPLASAISWARPTSRSAPSAMPDRPPRRSHRPSEWANTAAWATSPSRKMRSFGHEHVVEDHEALGVVVVPGDREVADVVVARRVGGVDDLHAGGVHRAPCAAMA